MTIATAEQLADLLRAATEAGRRTRINGAGTKEYLGEAADDATTLETSGIAGVVEHVPADLTVTVKGGTRLADLQAALGAAGQFLPLDPPHAAEATIGGVVATNGTGFGALRYGGVRDLLIGLRIALADGSVVRSGGRVVKNVAGYDLCKLFTGSMGTLGVIVEATFKVLPLPERREGAACAFTRADDAFGAAAALARTSLRPAAIVVDTADRVHWRLLVAAAGAAPVVDRTIAETERAAGRSVERVPDPEALLGSARELVARIDVGAVVRVALPLATQPAFAATATRLEPFARLVADAGTGIARVHLRGDEDAVITAAHALVAAARVLGGSARIERREPASLRARLAAWPEPPAAEFLMRRIKAAFDPAGILEPGRSAIG